MKIKDVERMASRTPLGRKVQRARSGMRLVRTLRSLLTVVLALVLLVVLAITAARLVTDQSNGKLTTSLGEERRYILHVPESYSPGEPAALVISLHGYMDWPAHQQDMTGWNDLADEHGFLVVYPMGLENPKRWRAYEPGGSNPDVVFIAELIDKLAGEYNLDPARIYANGLSNGAGMAFRLSCDLPERIAATGLVAGAYLLPWDQCTNERPVPAMVFHGTADPIVPFQGGPSKSFNEPFPEMYAWADRLAQHNGCSGVISLPQSGAVSGIQYTGCAAEVIFYVIEGGGHTWPGGKPLPESITGITTQDIDATALMWAFFQEHPLR